MIYPRCPQNNNDVVDIEKVSYASTVESLMYLQACVDLDITFIVNVLGIYFIKPSVTHCQATNRVIRSLHDTTYFMLTIGSQITLRYRLFRF